MGQIINPILRGFNPDPSIVRVGHDYYIATSTFEWFPGVQIHHSKDLIHWELVAHPLNRVSQLDMKGNPSSGGIWAPCLSYDQGTFYLVYTDVKTKTGLLRDTLNYLVTTDSVTGEWSEPVFLNASGFDPSLFHDEDGRKWLVNMLWDHRTQEGRFAGIILQEYSAERHRLVGPIWHILKGTGLRAPEGPHLYRRGGYYYLLIAEGGTGYNHSARIFRSRDITGPYEPHPDNPILTSRANPDLPLQKAGHADLVETQTGDWYMVHLCGRPLPSTRRCTLGRETAIQKVVWDDDGWLRLAGGGNEPSVVVPAPDLPEHPFAPMPEKDDFDSPRLDINLQTLRVPLDEGSMSLTERPGYLRLRGRESLSSKHHQSLVARRWQSFQFTATTCVEFEPETYQQMAGLVCLYDVENFYYLNISRDEKIGKCLGIMIADNNAVSLPLGSGVCIEGWERCYLRVVVDYDRLQFYYSPDGEKWTEIGPCLDASKLSDEYCRESSFTGAFVGLCCQDLSGRRRHADFDFFEYRERCE